MSSKKSNGKAPLYGNRKHYDGVRKARWRQTKLHEIIRVYSHESAKNVKLHGKENNLIDLLAEDSNIPLNKDEICEQLNPEKYIGRSVSQVDDFLKDVVKPLLDKYQFEKVEATMNI